MITRREAALRLDISVQMAARHGIGARITESELAEIEARPPAWLVQSRANRTGRRPVWVTLTCAVCGHSETMRPKKWWPDFTYVVCSHHTDDEEPAPLAGTLRCGYDGVGDGFRGLVDAPA